jgi:hypothetical protein
VLLVAIGLLAATSCSADDGSGQAEPSSPDSVSAVENSSGDAADVGGTVDDEVVFVDGPIEPMAQDLASLGDLSFSTDPSMMSTATYEPGATSFELELAAPDGYVWTLQVPPLALGRSTAISLTALVDLHAEDIPGHIVSGIQLEPDGLEFDVPATLTLSGGTTESSTSDGGTVVFGGEHDGTAMNFAMPIGASLSSVQVTHFSTYAADAAERAQLDELTARAEVQYQELQRRARVVLADRQLNVPVPPALPLRCASGDESTANDAAMTKFRDAFADPEIVLAVEMLAVGANLQLLGSDTDVFATPTRLIARSVTKARALLLEYGNDVRYLPAVGAVLLNALTNAQRLGIKDPETDTDFAELAALYRGQIRGLLDELIDEHEYRNVQAILDLERWAGLLVGSKDPDALLASIEGAMRFELQLDWTLVVTGNQTYVIESTVPVRWDTGDGRTNHLTGSDTGSLTSYTHSDDPEVFVRSAPFPVTVDLSDFSPCEGTAKVHLSPLAPETETLVMGEGEGLTVDMAMMMESWIAIFEEFEDGGAYVFPVELRNGDATAVEVTVDRAAPESGGQVVASLGVQLVHQPERT